MSHASHTETAFEEAIEDGLLATERYEKRPPSAYDAARALFPDDVVGFTQPNKWAALDKLLGDRTAATVLDALGKELGLKGTLHVLRHGFKCYGKTFRLAYFRPNSGMNPEAAARYAQNRLTITRQVAFKSVLKKADGKHRRCIIDVVLALNGLPVVTAELKNPLTGQRASDAVEQYQTERDGRDLLFAFKQRALVHFAVDPDEVWMTTRLKGKETTFLPFNRGHNHTDGSIDLSDGVTYPLKGPTDVGTSMVREDAVVLSSLVDKFNERFGTDFTEADQLFFDQIQASAEEDERIIEAAQANTLPDFKAFLERVIDELFIDRMEGNEDIFARVMTDRSFRAAVIHDRAEEIYKRVRDDREQ